jgi:hypothetical protein
MQMNLFSTTRTRAILTVLSTLLVILAVASCDLLQPEEESATPSTFDGSIYYPLIPGTSWDFSDSSRDRLYGYRLVASDTEEHLGESFVHVWLVSYEEGPPSGDLLELHRFGHDTLYYTDTNILDDAINSGGPVSIPVMIMNPSRIHASIRREIQNNEYYSSILYRTIGQVDSIVTPAGTFRNCLYIEAYSHHIADDKDHLFSSMYFAPNVGPVLLVGFENAGEEDDSTWHWALTSFQSGD